MKSLFTSLLFLLLGIPVFGATYNYDTGAKTLEIILGTGESLTVAHAGGNTTFALSSGTFTQIGPDAATGSGTAVLTIPDLNLANALAIRNTGAGAGTNALTFTGGTITSADISVQLDAAAATGSVTFSAAVTEFASTTATIIVNKDVRVTSAAAGLTTTSGALLVEANWQATPTSGSFHGVDVNGGSIKTTGTGTVTIKGRGGSTVDGLRGVFVRNGGKIEGGSSGLLTVEGVGGSSTGFFNNGIRVADANSIITSIGGDVMVTGVGGSMGTPGNNGINLMYGGKISAGGMGTVTVHGIGGAVHGSGIYTETGIITSSGGNVSVLGEGSPGNISDCAGLVLQVSTEISAGGLGSVTVQGIGGSGTGSNHQGLYLGSSSQITSSGGDVLITCQGGGTGPFGFMNLPNTAVTTAVNGGNITIKANSFYIGSTISTQTNNSVTLLPYTNGAAVNVAGGGDAGTSVVLSDAELDNITTGTLQLGDTNSGTITVSTGISRAANTFVFLQSAGDVVINSGGVNTAGGAFRSEGMNFSLNNGTITTGEGSVYLLHSGNVLIQDGGIQTTGASVGIEGAVDVTIQGSGINTTKPDNIGGGCYINNSGNVLITAGGVQTGGGYMSIYGAVDVTIQGTGGVNTAWPDNYGGGFYINNSGDVLIDEGGVQTGGGYMSIYGAVDVTIQGSGVNTALTGNNGGGFNVSNSGDVLIDDDGVQTGGGYMSIYGAVNVTIQGTGGVNTAWPDNYGGGFNISNSGDVLIDGGGVQTGGGYMSINGAVQVTVQGNGVNTARPDNYGGSLYISNSGDVLIDDSGVQTGGGYMSINGAVDVTIQGTGGVNTAWPDNYGGGFFISNSGDVLIDEGGVQTGGGYMSIFGAVDVTIQGTGGVNTSRPDNNGGGFYINNRGDVLITDGGIQTGGGYMDVYGAVNATVSGDGINTSRPDSYSGSLSFYLSADLLIEAGGVQTGGGFFSVYNAAKVTIGGDGVNTSRPNDLGGSVYLTNSDDLWIKEGGVQTGGGYFSKYGVYNVGSGNVMIQDDGLNTSRPGEVGGGVYMDFSYGIGNVSIQNSGVLTGGGGFAVYNAHDVTISDDGLNTARTDNTGGFVSFYGLNKLLIQGDGVQTGGGSFSSGGVDIEVNDGGINTKIDGGTDFVSMYQSGNVTLGAGSGIQASGNIYCDAKACLLGAEMYSATGEVYINTPNGTTPAYVNTDVSGTQLSFGNANKLIIAINGSTPGTGYNQLTVNGVVKLNDIELVLDGSYEPSDCQTYVLVDNDGADPIDGTFAGLPEGYVFSNFRGSGFTGYLTYVGGDGNDAVIELPDVTPPSITCPANTTVAANASCQGLLGSYDPAAVNDNCNPNPTVTQSPASSTVLTGHNAAQTVTLTADDGNGHTNDCTFTVTLKDATPPNITCPANTTVAANANCQGTLGSYSAVSVSDNCNPSPTVTQSPASSTVLTGHNTAQTVTLTANDGNGNTKTCTLTVTLKDVTPPSITCPANTTVAANASCQGTLGSYSAASTGDNCNPAPTVTQSPASSTVLTGHNTVQTVTLTANDGNGNTKTCTFAVTLKDVTPPGISCPGSLSLTCAGQVPAVNLATVTVSDNCGTPTPSHVGDVTTNMTCANRFTITRTYKATDGANNSATCSQVITVNDNVQPVFSGVPANVTVQCNSSLPAVGNPVATDGCSGTVPVTYNGQTQTNGSCANNYTLIRQWTATDACGNSKTATQKITVVDQTAPVFTSVPANVTVQCNALPPVGNPAATDGCSGTVSITYNGQTTMAGSCSDTYTLTRKWTASDACGNTRTATQRITVVDTQKPAFTAVPVNTTIECSDPVPPVGTPTATDNCDATVTVALLGQYTTSAPAPNAYLLVRVWKATDNCGNTATNSQVITVQDTQKPVFTSVPAHTTIECSDPFPVSPGTATATDNCDASVQVSFSGQTSAPGACPQSYVVTRTWVAYDDYGNTQTATQTITVVDTHAPVFTNAPANITLACGAGLPPVPNVAASDACDNTAPVTYVGEVSTGPNCPYTVSRTWTTTDDCGNVATHTQVITVSGQTFGGGGSGQKPSTFNLEPQTDPRADAARQTGAARNSQPITLQLAPNPARAETWVIFELETAADAVLSLYDADGRLALRQLFAGEAGANRYRLDLAEVPAGVYALQVLTDGQLKVKPLLVIKN